MAAAKTPAAAKPAPKRTKKPPVKKQAGVPSRALRVVAPNEAPPPPAKPKKLTVSAAAATGSQLELLIAMRDRVAKDVENPNTPARDLAALTRRLMEISREIQAELARAAENAEGAGASTPDDAWEAV